MREERQGRGALAWQAGHISKTALLHPQEIHAKTPQRLTEPLKEQSLCSYNFLCKQSMMALNSESGY